MLTNLALLILRNPLLELLKMDSLKAAIEALKKKAIASVLSKFTEIIAEKESEIMSLRNRVTDLVEQQVSEQEIYRSNDCIITENMLYLDMKFHLWEQVCFFFERYLCFTTNAYNSNACHYLSRRRDERFSPAIIVKFVYFDGKKTSCMAETHCLQEKNIG